MDCKTFIFLFVNLVMVASCGNDRGKQAQMPAADLLPTDTITGSETYKDWRQYYSSRNAPILTDSFTNMETGKAALYTTSVKQDDSFYRYYGKLLVYNQDSSAFIDMFSYSLIIGRNREGDLTARGGEPDQEVAIVFPGTGRRTRIWFCGTSCSVEQGLWIDRNTVALLGMMDEDGNEFYTPAMWTVNITTGETVYYSYPSEIKELQPLGYVREKLLQAGIKMEY